MLEYGADINKVDSRGNLPIASTLEYAIPFQIFQLLLHNQDLILNDGLIQQMLSSINRNIESQKMIVDANS